MIKCEAYRNEFNKFNNTEARMSDSTYHMTFSVKKSRLSAFTQRYNEHH